MSYEPEGAGYGDSPEFTTSHHAEFTTSHHATLVVNSAWWWLSEGSEEAGGQVV